MCVFLRISKTAIVYDWLRFQFHETRSHPYLDNLRPFDTIENVQAEADKLTTSVRDTLSSIQGSGLVISATGAANGTAAKSDTPVADEPLSIAIVAVILRSRAPVEAADDASASKTSVEVEVLPFRYAPVQVVASKKQLYLTVMRSVVALSQRQAAHDRTEKTTDDTEANDKPSTSSPLAKVDPKDISLTKNMVDSTKEQPELAKYFPVLSRTNLADIPSFRAAVKAWWDTIDVVHIYLMNPKLKFGDVDAATGIKVEELDSSFFYCTESYNGILEWVNSPMEGSGKGWNGGRPVVKVVVELKEADRLSILDTSFAANLAGNRHMWLRSN
ncbi:uncharacterized protein AB675_5600 [Cyphellophora attinorum]|uniref:Uncharacterized protein n=1 Tax=Cyphellophora attinorum TaxID=1664694 RepID=A0A0N1P0H6_9EURO|nr:uncharacterized protein AB675_5600 [Phialophora attinorum]KPI42057.1 hypothetical protein AB675_5600 [Phialophora attinorum]